MPHVTESEAKEIAAHLASVMQGSGIQVTIIDSATMENSYCWVFFYQSKAIPRIRRKRLPGGKCADHRCQS
jgi:hypothetical protein